MPEAKMLINYVPGEECRVAIVEDGKLEEYHVERFAQASRVGNIYVGRVQNVEPAIQAAFVDFGIGDNGFLHVSDIHPRYFPGEEEDTTERVGFKTPRRERPPIQQCLRRGDEVIVQVLKEGVGTKGPTLTSYLSIPGRFLVMMPYMDRTGVSRKVEDEEQRRQMREILDQLELPEGFGFIVRTAGMERNKTELKRDLAYLQRLWKDMERRLRSGDKPRLLYSESDLLVRSLRDLLAAEVVEVIIDHEAAVKRAGRFMKIVAPRGQARLQHYTGKTPVFHAFGIEQQVALIHAREVPLPSGGRLVIDQTEALVAIDVNSGKSRESRDSETNAYQTNVEAVDEICRQLRLRDMGGIIINDLIDMRHASHRKDIEARVKERLKRDRARSTVLSISEFGILEMTRQRMRPSHESVHFLDCPTCRGRGLVQRPDSIASDALRDMSAILDAENVAKVEMVVAPRVAGELLSTKRQLLSRVERGSGKHVDVRVSEQMPVDRVSFYAYDAQGADVDLGSLPRPRKPKDLVECDLGGDEDWAGEELEEAPPPEPEIVEGDLEPHPIELDLTEDASGWQAPPGHQPAGAANVPSDEGPGRRRRRRGRRGRGRDGEGQPTPTSRQRQPHPRQPQPHRAQYEPVRTEPKLPVTPVPSAGGMGTFAGDHGDADVDGALRPPSIPHDAPTGPLAGAPPSGVAPGLGEGQGPDGMAGQGGLDGPGGGRRRRRRRGRRGRGRGGQDGPAGTPLPGDQQQAPQPRGGLPGPHEQPATDFAGQHDEHREPVHEAGELEPEHAGPPQTGGGAAQDGDAGEGQGGGRRRRRRRRGRGGRGGGGGDGQAQPQGGGQPQASRPPQDERGQSGQGHGGRGGYRNSRYASRPSGDGAPNPPAQAPPPPAQQPPPAPGGGSAAPKPRLLYAASRRKLNASELNRRPKPE